VAIGKISTDTTQTTIRYDTRCYFNVRSKADISQLNLPQGESSLALLAAIFADDYRVSIVNFSLPVHPHRANGLAGINYRTYSPRWLLWNLDNNE